MCGSSGGGGLFGGGSNDISPQPYTPHAPLTYQGGQWTQNGQPVNPAGGITPGIPGIPSTSPAAAIMGATGGATGGAAPPDGSGSPFNPANAIKALGGLSKGLQFPTQQVQPVQQNPVTPAGPTSGNGNIMALLASLLSKKGA